MLIETITKIFHEPQKFTQKLKYEEVANLLGISEGAVKVRIHRTLKELKQHYQTLEGRI